MSFKPPLIASRTECDGFQPGGPPGKVSPDTMGLLPIDITTSALANVCQPPPQAPTRPGTTTLAGWSTVIVEKLLIDPTALCQAFTTAIVAEFEYAAVPQKLAIARAPSSCPAQPPRARPPHPHRSHTTQCTDGSRSSWSQTPCSYLQWPAGSCHAPPRFCRCRCPNVRRLTTRAGPPKNVDYLTISCDIVGAPRRRLDAQMDPHALAR